GAHRSIVTPAYSFQHIMMALFLLCLELVLHYGASTAIPPEGRVIVSGRPDRFGFFVPGHCFSEAFVSQVARAQKPGVELVPSLFVMYEPRVILPFISS